MSARTEWEALNEQDQMRMITGSICKAAHNKGLRVDPLAHAGDTWMRVMDKLDANKDLPLIVMDAAEMALQKAMRHERRAAACADFEVQGADGDTARSVLEIIAGVKNVEEQAITRADFSAFLAGLDGINRKIVDGLASGFSAREIAQTVSMTHTAVNKRIHAMRAVLAPCMA